LPEHKPETALAPTDVEILTPEDAPHLKSESAKESAPNEETLSKKNTPAAASTKTLSEPSTNQVQKGKPLSATHGPVLVESPAPVIPEYLKNRDLNTKVVIEFTVLPSGEAQPRLLVSSGDDELDQVALETAKKWKFYPAETEHQAILSKIRLRILFSVK
jgi:protein TonB